MPVTGRPEPAPGLLRRLDAVARGAAPAVFTAVLMVAATAPVGLPSLLPAIGLACVFFWSVFRPAAMPAPAVFGLGLLQDLLGFAPLGVGVLTLLLVHGTALWVRRYLTKRSFLIVWLAYAGFAVAAVALGYLLQAVLNWQAPPRVPALAQLGFCIGLYPLLASVLTRAHKGMQRAEEMA